MRSLSKEREGGREGGRHTQTHNFSLSLSLPYQARDTMRSRRPAVPVLLNPPPLHECGPALHVQSLGLSAGDEELGMVELGMQAVQMRLKKISADAMEVYAHTLSPVCMHACAHTHAHTHTNTAGTDLCDKVAIRLLHHPRERHRRPRRRHFKRVYHLARTPLS